MPDNASSVDTRTDREDHVKALSAREPIRALGFVSLGLLVLGIVGLALHNLGNRYFWTDESSSFFTALGWPGPGQSPGGLSEIQQTLITFLDPGLYHLMIRGWFEVFGGGIESLRSLPFIFFVIYVVTLLLWYRRMQLPLLIGVAGVSIMMLENITPYYSVEVRAYSASLAAAVALPLAALWLTSQPTNRRFFTFLLLGAFFGAMQYTAASVNIAVAILLGTIALRRQTQRKPLIIAAAAFMALWLPIIYLATRGWPSGGAEVDLDHVRSLVLGYMDTPTIVQTLKTNFLSFTALPRTSFLIIVPSLMIIAQLQARRGVQKERSLSPTTRVVEVWIYVLALTLASALLSIGGFLPWVLGTRWSITEVAGVALSVLGILSLVRDYLPGSWLRRRSVAVGTAVLCLILIASGSWRLWTYERPGNSQALDELVPVLVSGDPSVPIVVDYWIFPDTRYWVEFSGLYEPWRDEWIDRGVESTDGFVEAGAGAIEKFLNSPSDRMLLKDDQALKSFSAELPANVLVVYPDESSVVAPGMSSAPLVLVKD